jgi:formamidopyrimidine-DNA glycosylase
MFELPECVVLAKQMNDTLQGKIIIGGDLGNSPHKFVWYNRSPEEFDNLIGGKSIGTASAKGRWLLISIEPGYTLVLGECGGKILYHEPGSKFPKKYHMSIKFADDSFLTATTQMWGAMELYQQGEELNREYIKDMRPTPLEKEFTFDYFSNLIDTLGEEKKRSAKSLLTQDQIIPGLGNAIAQDILFQAKIHPRHDISQFTSEQRQILFDAIINTVDEIVDQGGRYDEYDLNNQKGKYIRLMDKNAIQQPCPSCGGKVIKIQYLGGSCYLCPNCQE